MTANWEKNYQSLSFTRRGRCLTIVMNQPDTLNAVNHTMHCELAQVFTDAAMDEGSDVIVLTGAGRAFSAGGDFKRMEEFGRDPTLFFREDRAIAKRIIFSLLDVEKPVISRIHGPAVGLGATLALMCDVSFAADHAKIGDPHVAIGLTAGDGGAVIWPQLIGFNRAKEYLLTGELMTGKQAAAIGLVNHSYPAEELDTHVDAFVDRLLAGAPRAIQWTKVAINLELKRIAHALMDVGLAYESMSSRTADHAEAVQAVPAKRKPDFTGR